MPRGRTEIQETERRKIMGEVLVTLFIIIWLTLAGLFAYKQLKKEYKDVEGTKK